MNRQNQRQVEFIRNKEFQQYRRDLSKAETELIMARIGNQNLSYMERVTLRLELFLQTEVPVFLEDTHIQGIRTIRSFPSIYLPGEKERIQERHHIHEGRGPVSNVAWDYQKVLLEGLENRKKHLLEGHKEDSEFVSCAVRTINAIEGFVDRYGECMAEHGQMAEAESMCRAIRYGAATMLQALQVFRMIHFCIWASGCYHNTVGRFDQWIYPFYRSDVEKGILTRCEAFDLIEDFFISFNRDHDLYIGLKNSGQSIMLAGMKPDGSDGINEITHMCLEASYDLRLVDPKINVRVNKKTEISFYEECTKLTKTGIGFPQYSNDDIVIPGLIALGYREEDARNYSVAACWEFIVPGNAMDIPNFGAMPLANIVDRVIRDHLIECGSLQELYTYIKDSIERETERILSSSVNLYIEPSPLMSVLMRDSITEGKDISQGALYNNYGFHGTGFACAVDQLAAVLNP